MIHDGQDKTETTMVSITETSPVQTTDHFEMFLVRQDKTETNMVCKTETSPEQPTNDFELFLFEKDKTETNMVSDTEISHEQHTDKLETLHCGQDKTETNLLSDPENKNKLTFIPLDQTCTDHLMDKAFQTSEKVDTGTECVNVYQGNVCGNECKTSEC
ncbi:Hypothetical predicted protein, partial [Mytilus galloprovincialis]